MKFVRGGNAYCSRIIDDAIDFMAMRVPELFWAWNVYSDLPHDLPPVRPSLLFGGISNVLSVC